MDLLIIIYAYLRSKESEETNEEAEYSLWYWEREQRNKRGGGKQGNESHLIHMALSGETI